MDLSGMNSETDVVWAEIAKLQGETFRTAKGLEFNYEVRGYEIFISRRDKSITRSTVDLTYRRAMELLSAGEIIDGPKKLGTFGASYLYPIFLRLGIIPSLDEQLRIPL